MRAWRRSWIPWNGVCFIVLGSGGLAARVIAGKSALGAKSSHPRPVSGTLSGPRIAATLREPARAIADRGQGRFAPMALKGELLSADLSNVFQMLAMNGKRGLLTVQDRVNPVARRRFFLDAQTVVLAEPLGRKPSLALLVEMGRISYEHYSSAMQRAKRFN